MTITRFAPSPTGFLHIGGLRTALYCYLWARKNGGKFVMRIEDTDQKRNSEAAAAAIVEAFKWVGIEHDGEIFYQSKRFDIYKKYVQKLLDEGKAYYCYMSDEERVKLREEQQAKKERTRYDGRYRDFTGTPPAGIEPVVRIKAPQSGKISFDDGVKGRLEFDVKDILDDFVIARKDGSPLYNFSVVIDDALMGINEVIRGDDHVPNTPKQIVLYEALGFEIPKFYHVPMILNPQGKKLSKRDGATDVMDYQKNGYMPQALLNFLVRLGWSHGDQEIFSLDEMIKFFDPNDINKSASAFNNEKLTWLNAHYIKECENAEMVGILKGYECDLSGFERADELLELTKERAKNLNELASTCNAITNAPSEYNEKDYNKFIDENALHLIGDFIEACKSKNPKSADDYETIAKELMAKLDIKMKNFAQPLRIAIVGSTQSPSIYDLLHVVGVEQIVTRCNKLLEFAQKN